MAASRGADGAEQRGARSAGPVRCSGAVLLRAADNGRLYCTWKATLLAAGVCEGRAVMLITHPQATA